MKVQKLKTILSTIDYDTIALKDTDGNVIFKGNDVAYNLSRYSEYYCIGYFNLVWDFYIDYSWREYYKAYKAMQEEYNPIQNYKMIESGIDVNQDGSKIETKEPLRDVNGNVLSTLDTTTTTEGTVTNINYVTTFDDTTPRLETYSTQKTGAYSDTKPTTNTTNVHAINAESYSVSTTHERTEVEYKGDVFHGDSISTHDFTREGNIGVTTSQKMIDSEIELRQNNILEMFVDNFIKRYCFFAGHDYDIEVLK